MTRAIYRILLFHFYRRKAISRMRPTMQCKRTTVYSAIRFESSHTTISQSIITWYEKLYGRRKELWLQVLRNLWNQKTKNNQRIGISREKSPNYLIYWLLRNNARSCKLRRRCDQEQKTEARDCSRKCCYPCLRHLLKVRQMENFI